MDSQFQLIAQRIKDLEKMWNYVYMQEKNTTDKLGITERPTEKEVKELRNRILASKTNED